MKEKGELLSKYGGSKSLIVVFTLLAVIFAAVGVFLLLLIPKVGKDFRFDGDISILYSTSYGMLGVAVVILAITIISIKSQPVFYLYEKAILSKSRGVEKLDYFSEISDLFIFLYGGFGYRVSIEDSWIYVGARTSKYADLKARFTEQHTIQRGEKLYQELMAGKTVTFYAISDWAAKSKSIFATRKLDYPLKKIELTRNQLEIDDKAIMIKEIADIKTNYWTEKQKIMNRSGAVLHSIHPAAIMSFDVLYYLIGELQEADLNEFVTE